MSSLQRIGFGTYRVDARTEMHRLALERAFEKGIELIDTSTNYGFGSSEEAVGKFLSAHSGDRPLKVISKAGYMQGPLLKEISHTPEVTQLGPDLAHCIHPQFLHTMLDRSLKRLGQSQIESYLLHNPEYFLKRSPDHAEYYRRIEKAFHALEDEADAGRIRTYGVSSNTFIEDRQHPEFTSLEVLLEIRERVAQARGTPSRFQVIQFPLNLFESEAAVLANQSSGTVLELARSAGLTTLANRPLNAFTRKHLVRLASFRHQHHVDFRALLSRVMDEVTGWEAKFPAAGDGQASVRPVFWGHLLKENFKDLMDLEQWRNFLNWRIRPSLLSLEEQLAKSPAHASWWKEYEPRLEGLLQVIDSFMENLVAERSERLRVRLVEAAPKLRGSKTLSQAALRIYLSIPGLNYVLLGMRNPTYVDDASAAVQAEPLTPDEALSALQAAAEFLVEFEEEEAAKKPTEH